MDHSNQNTETTYSIQLDASGLETTSANVMATQAKNPSGIPSPLDSYKGFSEAEIDAAIPIVPREFVEASLAQKELRALGTKQLDLMNQLEQRTDFRDPRTGEFGYVKNDEQRRVLAIQIKGLENTRTLQAQIAQRTLAAEWLASQRAGDGPNSQLAKDAAFQAAVEERTEALLIERAALAAAERRERKVRVN